MTGDETPLMRRLLLFASSSQRDPNTAPRLCAEAHTLIEKLTAALRDVEWAGNSTKPALTGRCPQCRQTRGERHLPACVVSHALVAAELAGVAA